MPELVLVVPCHDEAGRLDVPAFRAFLDANPAIDLLFVDDGSHDTTAAVCNTIHARASVLRLPTNQGKGEAVRAGVLQAASRAPVIGWWDADLATPLDAVADLWAGLADPAVDIVLGSRVKLLGRAIERRPLRHYIGRVAATAVSLTLGLAIYDSQCGAKLMRSHLALELFQAPFLTRWMFDVELLVRLRTAHPDWDAAEVERHVHEVPLRAWREVPGSHLRWTDIVTVPWQLWRIRRAASRLPLG